MTALSIRQPWAWLIAHGYKDIENRTWHTKFRGKFLIHASAGMTRREYEEAAYFACRCGVTIGMIPSAKAIERGGIVGEAEIVDCVSQSDSPWFCGPWGFVLENPQPCQFRPFTGSLGLFHV